MAKEKSLKTIEKEKSSSSDKTILENIKERQTEELVIAFCGPLGSGISSIVELYQEVLEDLGYDINRIKLSTLIIKYSLTNKEEEELATIPQDERITRLQDAGNELRLKYGNDILSIIAIQEIAIERKKKYVELQLIEKHEDEFASNQIKSIRVATLIDSLKHPAEVDLLKAVYGNMLYLVGVLCPEQVRQRRLNDSKNIPKGKEYALMERDKSEDKGFGQKLIDTLHKSDFFIRNDKDNISALKPCIERYAKLILGDPFISPTKDENAMYAAQSAALRSSCLSSVNGRLKLSHFRS